jgi:hypothetical protein
MKFRDEIMVLGLMNSTLRSLGKKIRGRKVMEECGNDALSH